MKKMDSCQTCSMLIEVMAKHNKQAHAKSNDEKIKALEEEEKD